MKSLMFLWLNATRTGLNRPRALSRDNVLTSSVASALSELGARQDERTDITVEITAAAARELNTLKGAQYQAAHDHFLSTKEMRLQGDPSSMGAWREAVHDPIVDRAS
jgi:hypothetical protein